MPSIDMVLEIAKGFNAVSNFTNPESFPYHIIISVHISMDPPQLALRTSQTSAQDERVRRRLEYCVRYIAELLEPFYMMRRHEISTALQSQVLTLGR
jgi:hypothetical protein